MEKQDLGKEIYRVKRSKIFGRKIDFLFYSVFIFLACAGVYMGNFKGCILAVISLVMIFLFFGKKKFKEIIFYENAFVIRNYFAKSFQYSDLYYIFIQDDSTLSLKNIGNTSINFYFKNVIYRFLFSIDTSLITKEEAKKIIEIFKEKGVKYVEYDNAKL